MTQKDTNSPHNMDRRRFVGGAATLASGAALATAGAAAAADDPCEQQCRVSGCDFDVVVIGGGFGGATAARDCHKQGLKTLLLEARNRLGGRTFATEFEGVPIELGGAWIHNTQPFVWAEAQRYGINVLETPGAVADTMQVVMPDGERSSLTLEQFNEVAAGWELFCARAREILPRPYDLLHNRDAALAAEKISAVDHLETLELTPLQKVFNECMVSVFVNNEAADMSYLEVLRFHLLGGGCFPTLMDATTRFQIDGGTSRLINSILADSDAEVRLSTAVKSVHDQGELVVITTNRGDEIRCGAVICSVPMNSLPAVDFRPALPTGVIAAGKEGHPGQGVKIYMKVEGDVGNFAAFSTHLPMNYAMTYKQGKDYTVVVGFGPGDDRLDPYDEESVQDALRFYLPDAVVSSVMHYDWSTDPYSRGTWATYRKGWVEKYYNQFQGDAGRVLFASGDHGEGWRGTIDGAIAAGSIAARKANQLLA